MRLGRDQRHASWDGNGSNTLLALARLRRLGSSVSDNRTTEGRSEGMLSHVCHEHIWLSTAVARGRNRSTPATRWRGGGIGRSRGHRHCRTTVTHRPCGLLHLAGLNGRNTASRARRTELSALSPVHGDASLAQICRGLNAKLTGGVTVRLGRGGALGVPCARCSLAGRC